MKLQGLPLASVLDFQCADHTGALAVELQLANWGPMLHGLNCRFSKGRHSRHTILNVIIKCVLDSARILCHLEPTGQYRSVE